MFQCPAIWSFRTSTSFFLERHPSDRADSIGGKASKPCELKPACVQQLRRQTAIERVDPRQQRVVEPVLGINHVQVIPGFEDPSEPRLPAEDGALRVVL